MKPASRPGDRRPLPASHPVSLLATWFGCGLLRPAPGTWGSLGALPPAALLVWAGGPWALAAGIVVVLLIGIWAGERYAESLGRHDPGAVVIDEVAAQWLTLLPLCFDLWQWAIAFVLFRAADILKPWPASWCDRRLEGGLGIMADDLVAGLYAGAASVLIVALLWEEPCFPWI